MSKDRIYYMGKIRVDTSDRDLCYFCGNPADIKIGLWSYLKPMAQSNEQGWREVLICYDCNEEHKYVDLDGLADTGISY